MQKPRSFADTLRITVTSNWFYLLLLAFLILFPYIVAWVTGDPVGGVGGRPRGESIRWQGVFVELFVFVILAMSYNLMFGFSGVISFGHALFFGIGGYTTAILLGKTGFVDWLTTLIQPAVLEAGGEATLALTIALFIAMIVALIIAGLVGLLMGLVTLRLKGVYFAIFTLALSEMALIYVRVWAFTDAEDGFSVNALPDFINPTQNRLTYYYVALFFTIATFLIIRRLMNSPTGRVLLAIRENEDRAQAIGYNTLRYKLLAIVVASMMAALAGIIHFGFNKRVGPEMFSVRFTIQPLLMTIIGGIGTFSGPVLGATLLDLSEVIFDREFEFGEFVLNVGEYWSLILGIAFIVVVLVFPQGIVGSVRNQWAKWRSNNLSPPPDTQEASATGD
ncbi:MAG: branched-chain amino acid ABC transporter permease [Chloroflexota bacterium]